MDAKDKHGRLPLSHAARYGSEVVEKLLVVRDELTMLRWIRQGGPVEVGCTMMLDAVT